MRHPKIGLGVNLDGGEGGEGTVGGEGGGIVAWVKWRGQKSGWV